MSTRSENTPSTTGTKTATIYRMVMPDHVCPYGIKTLDLLERQGFEVEDVHLETDEETTAFREKWNVETTPQTFVDGELIGTLDDVREFVGKKRKDGGGTSYWPVLTLFAVTILMAAGAAYIAEDQWVSVRTFEWFIAFSMCGLGYLKIRDVESFSTMFLNYDLLARRWVPYSYVYPWAETGAGLLMIAAVLNFVSVPVALFIGSVGAASVVKAVYIDKRELKCACVGGSSNVPLGFVSFTENVAMVAMAIWMGAKHLL
ncbi:MauE/DoxX family redox-associated membrane protein [Ilumatobacter nonamiensis]|uniref:MauE/DoxX family redox-associated membrane protein n=1 Tax=Ilumatobacter nonamiensis TaxID=467093 RepID=UPI000687B70A|nr:glutaredoxin [Ilumatobacter nonamiensis]